MAELTVDQIREVLRKRDMRVLGTNHWHDTIVGFVEKKKSKVGTISSRYLHRYGVKTFASMPVGGTRPWIQSHSDEVYITDDVLKAMQDGDFSAFPAVDVDKMEILW